MAMDEASGPLAQGEGGVSDRDALSVATME